MPHIELFSDATHRNVLLEGVNLDGKAVQANQHLIIHNGVGMILDPGGHRVYGAVLSETFATLGDGELGYIFLSHQDPDIVAAINGWLMATTATPYISRLWERFVAHFTTNEELLFSRLKLIPDEGMNFDLNGLELKVLPAHFLHSAGNFQIYDPYSKILYSGDLGASIADESGFVENFDAHLPLMEPFHKRYMASNAALRAWVRMVDGLDIETIAPQHGAMFKGRDMVERFKNWADNLACGVDLLADTFRVPA